MDCCVPALAPNEQAGTASHLCYRQCQEHAGKRLLRTAERSLLLSFSFRLSFRRGDRSDSSRWLFTLEDGRKKAIGLMYSR